MVRTCDGEGDLHNKKNSPVFGLGVFSMARRHALVSLRHAAPPSAMLPFFLLLFFFFFFFFFFRINIIII